MHHGRGLRRELEKQNVASIDVLIDTLSSKEATFEDMALAKADAAMLGYARKLTLEPAAIREADVVALRDAGFDDLAIHDICCVTSYFNFANRVADGLGIELER